MPNSTVLILTTLILAAVAAPAGAALQDEALAYCGAPSEAANDTASLFPKDPEPDKAACPGLCAKWVATCKGVVGASKACWNTVIGKIGTLRTAVCSAFDNRDAGLKCRKVLDAERAEAKLFLADDFDLSVSTCEKAEPKCLLSCSL